MPTIILSGHRFSYTLSRKSIFSIRLRFKSHGSFVISAPRLTPQFVVQKFIESHSAWIIKHNPPSTAPAKFDSLTILDTVYRLNLRPSSRDSVVVFPESNEININTPQNTPAHLKKLLDQKLRPFALKLINQELRNLKSVYNFKYQKVSIRNQSSRFGSCSQSGNLSFNWQIVLFPYPIFRHIILHELTHTIHHDHSHRFWAQFAKFDPQYITHRSWLKKSASKFMIFS